MPEEKPIVIVDMDGTLADVGHRLHYIRGKGKQDWKKFFSEQRHDLPIKPILKQVCELASNHEIVIVTGRPEQYFHETQQWLRKYKVPYSRLYMRPAGDHRPDFLVKRLEPTDILLRVFIRPDAAQLFKKGRHADANSSGFGAIPFTSSPSFTYFCATTFSSLTTSTNLRLCSVPIATSGIMIAS